MTEQKLHPLAAALLILWGASKVATIAWMAYRVHETYVVIHQAFSS